MDDLIDFSDIEVDVPFAAIRADSCDAAELNSLRSLYAELEAYRQFEELEAKQSLLRDMASLVGNSNRINVLAPGAQPYGEAPQPNTDSWGNQLPDQRENTVPRQNVPNTFINRDNCVTERAPREAPLAHSSYGPMEAQNNDFYNIMANISSQMRLQTDLNSPWLSTFSGLAHEDPVEFVQDILAYCKENDLGNEDAKRVLLGRVKGDAKEFVKKQCEKRIPFEDILHKLVLHYNSHEKLAHAATIFYTEKQTTHEDVESFALRKQALYKRIHPSGSLRDLMSAVIERLRPELRIHLRLAHFVDLEDLIARSSKIELDLGEISQNTVNLHLPSPNQPTTTSNKPVSSIKCRTCGGDHFSFKCPKKAQGNMLKLTAIEGPVVCASSIAVSELPKANLNDNIKVKDIAKEAAGDTLRKARKRKPKAENKPLSTSGHVGICTMSDRKPNQKSSTNPQKSNRPMITIKMLNKQLPALIDTGADVNLICESLIAPGNYRPDNTLLQLATESGRAKAIGSYTQTIDIQGIPVKTKFLVVPGVKPRLILGMPFILETRTELDFAKGCAYMGAEARKITFCEKQKTSRRHRRKAYERVAKCTPDFHHQESSENRDSLKTQQVGDRVNVRKHPERASTPRERRHKKPPTKTNKLTSEVQRERDQVKDLRPAKETKVQHSSYDEIQVVSESDVEDWRAIKQASSQVPSEAEDSNITHEPMTVKVDVHKPPRRVQPELQSDIIEVLKQLTAIAKAIQPVVNIIATSKAVTKKSYLRIEKALTQACLQLDNVALPLEGEAIRSARKTSVAFIEKLRKSLNHKFTKPKR